MDSTEPDADFPLEAYLELLVLEPDQVPGARRARIFEELAARPPGELSPRAALWARAAVEADPEEVTSLLGSGRLQELLGKLGMEDGQGRPAGQPAGTVAPTPGPVPGRVSPRRLLGVALASLVLFGSPLAVIDHYDLYQRPTAGSAWDLTHRAAALYRDPSRVDHTGHLLETALVHARLGEVEAAEVASLHQEFAYRALDLSSAWELPGLGVALTRTSRPRFPDLAPEIRRRLYADAVAHVERSLELLSGLPDEGAALARGFELLCSLHQAFGEEAARDQVLERIRRGAESPTERHGLRVRARLHVALTRCIEDEVEAREHLWEAVALWLEWAEAAGEDAWRVFSLFDVLGEIRRGAPGGSGGVLSARGRAVVHTLARAIPRIADLSASAGGLDSLGQHGRWLAADHPALAEELLRATLAAARVQREHDGNRFTYYQTHSFGEVVLALAALLRDQGRGGEARELVRAALRDLEASAVGPDGRIEGFPEGYPDLRRRLTRLLEELHE